MGCCYSRVEREEIVSRCKARRRYMKELVKARQAFSVAHSMYIRSLRGTGSALLQFANGETNLHQNKHHLQNRLPLLPSPPLPPPTPPPLPPPPMSSSSDNWTSVTASPALPPPPPPPASSWDFWDPFAPSSSRSVTEEEWEATTVTTGSEVATANVAASVAAPPSVVSGYSKDSTSELAMVVSRNSKDLVEIIKELDEYFLKAADAGSHVSLLLEVSNFSLSTQKTTGKVYNCGKSLSPLWTRGSNSKSSGLGRLEAEVITVNGGGGALLTSSHSSTVERLYAWEKKLFEEVKNAESMKIEHKKRVTQLRKQEAKGSDYLKTEKNKKEIEKLESTLVVAAQAIETTAVEIIRLRESELYPQLLQLVNGLMFMWRSMYECHQVQMHIVEQLKFLNTTIVTADPTSEIHRQSTLQLELEVQQWHLAFCNLVQCQRDYIHSLTGWLRLSLFQFSHDPLINPKQNSGIYFLCEEWQLAVDRIPDKVASEGIKSLLTVIHAVVVKQAEEQKQKKKSEAAFKELEKKVVELRSLECKYGPVSMPETEIRSKQQDPVAEKRAKVEILRTKADEEKTKHEKLVTVTRAMTLNNLQMGLPNVFQAMTGFSNVCIHAFESVSNPPKTNEQGSDLKRLLP
ncbi:protein ALTERED PHOSPHATE STARVATION RESPONSE 1 [Telopea speciosissima]|uniref:protein ALTERED PHOSPHATE STARVATION RESPONSE 1 n=1 Tax=Telopea speciosissima TaxID=54955 RepID=UPI001CC66D44|nr:protein ALTERED PHOSPHATE STARVATION RESPONSE 1 [Telopea speciosissima]